MKRINGILWGLVLVAVGVIFALNALNLAEVEMFFDGWWTLFIIIPCLIGLFTSREKWGNAIGLAVGVVLLLACRDVLSFQLIWKLIIPIVIVMIGLRLIFREFFRGKERELAAKFSENNPAGRQYCATFSGQDLNFDHEIFEGAELTAVFGGVKCDLRNAVIREDVMIKVCSVFGGVEIFMPENVNVKISSTSVFGGMSDKRSQRTKDHPVTVYVSGSCIFGGAEIK